MVIFYFTIGIFIGNIRSPADCPNNLMKFHLVHILGKAVEYHQFTSVQLIYNQTPHIGIVVHKGCGIDKAHLLINRPVVRNVFKQELQLPHPVVFQNHPFCLMFFQQFGQMLRIQFRFIFNDFLINILCRISGNIIFFFALFAKQQQCAFALIEPRVFHGFLNEFGLAALQKTSKQVNRNIFRLFSCWHVCASFA